MGEVTRLAILFLGWMLLSHAGPAWAAPAFDYRVGLRVYNGDDGLPRSGVNAIVQTRDGYLWVATFDGLARFDGTKFTVFRRHPEANGGSSAPASDRIVSLFEDNGGRLWIGTENAGLSVHGRFGFRHLAVCAGNCQVNAIVQGVDRAIWVASSAGLLKIDPSTGEETWSDHGSPSGYALLAVDGRGTLFAGGADGFYVLADHALRPIELPSGDRGVKVLKRDGNGLLVGTEHALYRYLPAARAWQNLGVPLPWGAAQDAEGHWWVSQASGHVLHQDGRGGWVDVPELSVPGVGSLMWDREGDLWVGGGTRGLFKVRQPLFGLVSKRQLGTDMAGRAVVSDGGRGLWLGSACGGLFHWRPDGQVEPVPIRQALHGECVFSLLRDRRGVLWIGTAVGVLGRLDENGKPKLVEAWSGKGPVNLWQRDDGRYVVNADTATFELQIDDGGNITGRRRLDALDGMRIASMVKASNGGYWFVGDHGVLRLQDGRVVERWTPQQGLSSRFARALYESPTGSLWIGTYGGGLDRIEHGRLQHYDKDNGLFDDTVSCILPDEHGRLWLAGNLGVTLLPSPAQATTSIESFRFAARDGLVPAEINGGGSTPCHRDTQGNMWFSLVAGFGVVDAAGLPNPTPSAPITHIERVSVNGHDLDAALPQLTLTPFSRNLEIHYAAVSLDRPEETSFRFRLAGVDRDWVDAGQNRSILYPRIPWGAHRFEVQARVTGGPWVSAPAGLTFVHPQPWYQRPWVWSLITLAGLLVLVVSSHSGGDETFDDDAANRGAGSN